MARTDPQTPCQMARIDGNSLWIKNFLGGHRPEGHAQMSAKVSTFRGNCREMCGPTWPLPLRSVPPRLTNQLPLVQLAHAVQRGNEFLAIKWFPEHGGGSQGGGESTASRSAPR